MPWNCFVTFAIWKEIFEINLHPSLVIHWNFSKFKNVLQSLIRALKRNLFGTNTKDKSKVRGSEDGSGWFSSGTNLNLWTNDARSRKRRGFAKASPIQFLLPAPKAMTLKKYKCNLLIFYQNEQNKYVLHEGEFSKETFIWQIILNEILVFYYCFSSFFLSITLIVLSTKVFI